MHLKYAFVYNCQLVKFHQLVFAIKKNIRTNNLTFVCYIRDFLYICSISLLFSKKYAI